MPLVKVIKTLLALAAVSLTLAACGSFHSTPAPTPTPFPQAPAYAEVLNFYRSNVTDLQRADYNQNTLVGKKTNWDGWVMDIREKSDNYQYLVITLDMSGNPEEIGGKLYLIVPKNSVEGLEPDMRLYFLGIVNRVESDGNLSVSRATILPFPEQGTLQIQSYEDLTNAYLTFSSREWMAVRQKAVGTQVDWQTWVVNVTEEGRVVLSAAEGNTTGYIFLSGLPSEEALKLKMGAPYQLQARITAIKPFEKLINLERKRFVTVYLDMSPQPAATPEVTATPAR